MLSLFQSKEKKAEGQGKTSFQPPNPDLSRFPFPTKAFIGGSFVDSTGSEKHKLKSAVNDAIITTGEEHPYCGETWRAS